MKLGDGVAPSSDNDDEEDIEVCDLQEGNGSATRGQDLQYDSGEEQSRPYHQGERR